MGPAAPWTFAAGTCRCWPAPPAPAPTPPATGWRWSRWGARLPPPRQAQPAQQGAGAPRRRRSCTAWSAPWPRWTPRVASAAPGCGVLGCRVCTAHSAPPGGCSTGPSRRASCAGAAARTQAAPAGAPLWADTSRVAEGPGVAAKCWEKDLKAISLLFSFRHCSGKLVLELV